MAFLSIFMAFLQLIFMHSNKLISILDYNFSLLSQISNYVYNLCNFVVTEKAGKKSNSNKVVSSVAVL